MVLEWDEAACRPIAEYLEETGSAEPASDPWEVRPCRWYCVDSGNSARLQRPLRTKPRAEESKCQVHWMFSERETVVELPWLRTVVRAW